MNTVSIGDKFEELCYNIISNALSKNELGIIPEQCEVFRKKGYYSRDREKDIIFDLSIELWPPGSERYTLLYIIECKDYSSKSIPVDDIEEFYAKVIQVSGANVKAIFIASNSFQAGAYTYANSKGMMLIEVNEDITYNIILHKTKRYQENKIEKNLKNITYEKFPEIFQDQLHIRKIKRVIEKAILIKFISYLKDSFENVIGLKRYSIDNIEEIVANLIRCFDPKIEKENQILNIHDFVHFIKQVFDLKLVVEQIHEVDESGRSVLSFCSFTDKKIVIDKSILNTKRYRFALSHELGHFLLHNKLQICQNSYEKLSDSKYSYRLDRYLLENNRNWVEWQANQFAASLVMPKKTLYSKLNRIKGLYGLRPDSKLYVDDQKSNQIDFYEIIARLSNLFQTTKTSVVYRLNSLGLLDERYNVKHISQIIKDIMSDLN